MRAIFLILTLCLFAGPALAQSSTVLPGELSLSVEVEETGHTPFTREMVLITIRGTYSRHITREKLRQPDFEGFSWAQLGPDKWAEETIRGRKLKTFERRMAVYPDRSGTLTIGAFTHELTLTDEGDDWFDHAITSEPVTVEVAEAPAVEGWWFPVRRLRVSDEWSNAPALLKPGEGVLRVVRIEALGAMPEMIPPMPEMTSPSAMIFPHPEKRLVELSPEGPITYAFWRWTIRPTNDTSAIVEPLTFDYFDTTDRSHQTVTISAQRVAYGDLVPVEMVKNTSARAEASLPGWTAGIGAGLVFFGGIAVALQGRGFKMQNFIRRYDRLDPLARRIRRSARKADLSDLRRAARAMIARDGAERFPHRSAELSALDRAIFSSEEHHVDLATFARRFIRRP